MIEFYPEIRAVHIAAAFASGTIFFLRGIVLVARGSSAPAAALRYLSYTADMVLLTAAMMLVTVLRRYPFVEAWLTVKLVLLIVYLTLGIIAFRTAGDRRMRIASWVAGLCVFAFIVTVARAHHPLGFLSGWVL
jgi:uncharacterized membrane protein SirB2